MIPVPPMYVTPDNPYQVPQYHTILSPPPHHRAMHAMIHSARVFPSAVHFATRADRRYLLLEGAGAEIRHNFQGPRECTHRPHFKESKQMGGERISLSPRKDRNFKMLP